MARSSTPPGCAIADLAGITRRVMVYMGERAFNTPEGIEALPVMQFTTRHRAVLLRTIGASHVDRPITALA